MDTLQHLINGLLLGGTLALIGLGFSLVWGILNIVNLAHAAFILLAAYLTYYLWSGLGLDPFLSLPVTMIVLFGLGFLIQKYIINRVIRASLLVTFLLTFGIQSLLTNLALRFFSADFRQAKPPYQGQSFALGQLQIPYALLGGLLVALILTYLVYLFMSRTKIGNAIRAVGMDLQAGRLMGINISNIYALTFGIGAALAAAAGTLLAVSTQFSPAGFDIYNIDAFTVVVLGGLGSIPGALLGGLVLGIVSEFATTWLPDQAQVLVFALLIFVLVVKPTGLLGKEGYH